MSDILAHFVDSAAWSALGFVSGWFARGIARDIRKIRERSEDDDN